MVRITCPLTHLFLPDFISSHLRVYYGVRLQKCLSLCLVKARKPRQQMSFERIRRAAKYTRMDYTLGLLLVRSKAHTNHTLP
jgi:hypothetical protein